MKPNTYSPLVHWFSCATALAALLPIMAGALVTTRNWGMAFQDWPTSDGQNMLLYPWLADWFSGAMDKFSEHGHRLAGMVIGLMSIALVSVTFWKEKRKSVQFLAALVLAGVILQGVLGGLRVEFDKRVLALIHGSFAALVLALMVTVAVVTSRWWIDPETDEEPAFHSGWPSKLIYALPIFIYVQFVLGGFVRHLQTGLFEHLFFAIVVFAYVCLVCFFALRSRSESLQLTAWPLLLFVAFQIGLGSCTWVTKYGFPPAGFVAVSHSTEQVLFRTAHTIFGMLLLAFSVLQALVCFRVSSAKMRTKPQPGPGESVSSAALNTSQALQVSVNQLGIQYRRGIL